MPGPSGLGTLRSFGGGTAEPVKARPGAKHIELRFPPRASIEGRSLGLPAEVVGRFVPFAPATGCSATDSVGASVIPRASLRSDQGGSEPDDAYPCLSPGLSNVSAWVGGAWTAFAGRVGVC